jgi:hypothetical protein
MLRATAKYLDDNSPRLMVLMIATVWEIGPNCNLPISTLHPLTSELSTDSLQLPFAPILTQDEAGQTSPPF